MIDNETLDTMLWKKVSRIKQELNFTQIKAIADLFAHIVDYKSPFTSNHSIGVAEGAEKILLGSGGIDHPKSLRINHF